MASKKTGSKGKKTVHIPGYFVPAHTRKVSKPGKKK
jgi:hypothetical protein